MEEILESRQITKKKGLELNALSEVAAVAGSRRMMKWILHSPLCPDSSYSQQSYTLAIIVNRPREFLQLFPHYPKCQGLRVRDRNSGFDIDILTLAACGGNVEAMRIALERREGRQYALHPGYFCHSHHPLYVAARCGHREVVEILLESILLHTSPLLTQLVTSSASSLPPSPSTTTFPSSTSPSSSLYTLHELIEEVMELGKRIARLVC